MYLVHNNCIWMNYGICVSVLDAFLLQLFNVIFTATYFQRNRIALRIVFSTSTFLCSTLKG